MFTVVKKNTHYCGGTDKGCQYLEQEAPWIPYSFMGSLAAKPGRGYRFHYYFCSWRQIGQAPIFMNNHSVVSWLVTQICSSSFTSQSNAHLCHVVDFGIYQVDCIMAANF